MSDDTATRRTLLHGSALLGVAALLDACSASAGGGTIGPDGSVLPLDAGSPLDEGSPVDAGSPVDRGGSGADAALDDGGPRPAADVAPLNALLAAEYNAIAAYDATIPILQEPPTGDPLAANGPVLAAIATNWREHHRAHARELVGAVSALGGTPVAQSSVSFTPPTAFTPTVRNAMVLLCNGEKGTAIAYNQAVAAMTTADARYLATIIEGVAAQHFVVLYTLLKQVVAPIPAGLVTMIDEVVPRAFVNNTGTMLDGFPSIALFTYSA